ncbi:hypothetical protein TNCV_4135711 [Trichonephila clavipes]|nr:hypothetical protein TNCV_4135711 [Trichonephila clavipes]
MVLKVNDRRTSCPCHDELRGPRSDYVRQIPCTVRRHRVGTLHSGGSLTTSSLGNQISTSFGNDKYQDHEIQFEVDTGSI